jgi:precorrin-6A synthase
VVPGITAIQALCASHKIPLNRVGAPVEITTGRRLAEGKTGDADVVVMLDGGCAFRHVQGDAEIYWGAYLGSQHELALSGKISEVGDEIERVRTEARARHGWIMDTYLIRRGGP